MAMALKGLAGLSGLYALNRYFGAGAPDGYCLLRATQDVFFEMKLLDTRQLFPQEPLSPVRAQYAQMLAWFEGEIPPVPSPQRASCTLRATTSRPASSRRSRRRRARWCCCAWPSPARRWFSLGPACALGGQPRRERPLDASGLEPLRPARARHPEARLQRLPTAFKEGMAARAGLIGDLRHNHPRNWRWPRRVDNGAPIEPASAHVLVQLRCATPEAAAHLQAAIAALSGVSTASP